MNSIEKGKSILGATEKKLRGLVAEAANAGEYDAVLELASWASQLAVLLNGGGPKATERADTSRASPKRKPKQAMVARRAAKASPNGYPKFVRMGNDLVKIGWSKKSGEEYHHRAPYAVLSALAESLQKAGANGSVVSAHDLMPLDDSATSSEVPSYQVYLCLAWLRQHGLIEQQGRQGYTVPSASDLPKSVEDAWKSFT